MVSRFFKNDRIIAIRTARGEKRLHFSPFHQYFALFALIALIVYMLLLSAFFVFGLLQPSETSVVTQNVKSEYEARIEALVSERDNLVSELASNKQNTERLIDNLSGQQDLLFELERENYEYDLNLTNLRKGLVNSQNRLDALNLQVDAQKEQITALANGENINDSTTLATMTATLSETAIARDEARSEIDSLKERIALNEQKQATDAKRRDVLFEQIEDAVETSLVPLKSTLSKTGLNVDTLLQNVRKNYSGIGGIDASASFNLFGNSSQDAKRVDNLIGNLDELSNLSYAIRTLPLANPVKSNYRLSSGFGYRIHPITGRRKLHSGQDMAGPVGTPIYAPGDGKVIHASRVSGYGNMIKIQHANGIETLYGHLSRIQVNVGDHVSLGQQIGKMGSTGQSTGSHLHYEIKVNGTKVNPMNFIRASNYVQ